MKKGKRIRRKQLNRFSEYFSESYYLAQFPDTERPSVENSLEHFLQFWNQNKYDPSPFFSVSDYLEANPDVVAHQINPLVHYIENGIAEQRPLRIVRQAGQVSTEDETEILVSPARRLNVKKLITSELPEYLESLGVEIIAEPEHVDVAYYKSYFPGETILNCEEHFDDVGWKQGLNPNAWFNTKFYLDFYPDVANSGLNPFTHFISQGYKEFRLPNDSCYREFNSVLNGLSIESEERTWFNSSARLKIVDRSYIEREILKKKFNSGSLVLSIGHSAYLSDVGGIQLYTFVEAQKFNKLDINYLHISPSRTLPVLANQSQKDILIKLTFNNEELSGDVFLSDLVEIVASISPDKPPESVIVNSLYGWHPELLRSVLDQISADRHFWVFHDYSTFCSNPTLNFEKVSSCHNPSIGAGICSTCRYGQKRDEHVLRIRELLESRDWEMVTPSLSTSANVKKYMKIDALHVKTISHGEIRKGHKLRSFQEKPRIAFVGHPVVQKGWLKFLNLVDLGLDEFDFFHFGSVDANEPGIQYRPLVNQFDNQNAAQDILVEYQIDAVFISPTWEETFCFVAYEALSAGCRIICNSESGNVIDAAIGNSIIMDEMNFQSVARLTDEIIKAREEDRFISEFLFTGTIASEYVK